MSDMTMREAVLWEFTYDAGVHRLWRVADMADEIRRLRDENAAFRAEIDRLREERDALLAWKAENQRAIVEVVVDLLAAGVVPKGSKGLRDGVNGAIAALDTMRHRAERAERILAALREPSDGVVDAVADLGDSFEHLSRFDVRTAIRAAVAAAEQEVGRE